MVLVSAVQEQKLFIIKTKFSFQSTSTKRRIVSLFCVTSNTSFLSLFVTAESRRWRPGQELQGLEHQKSSQSVPTKARVGVSSHYL